VTTTRDEAASPSPDPAWNRYVSPVPTVSADSAPQSLPGSNWAVPSSRVLHGRSESGQHLLRAIECDYRRVLSTEEHSDLKKLPSHCLNK